MRIASWNVNGLRAAHRNGFVDWLNRSDFDVVCLQEIRASEEVLPEAVRAPSGWHAEFHSAKRPGYSGVATYSRERPSRADRNLGVKSIDEEGRCLITTHGSLVVVNSYFPNGNGKDRDNSRIPFKLRYNRELRKRLDDLRKADVPVVVLGDWNTAHEEIDLARPKNNGKTSGFTLPERKEFGRWIGDGWVDTFRHFEKGPGHYTWWRQFGGMREKNVGWRIDCALASPGAVQFLKAAAIHKDVLGSDHCPISVHFDPGVRTKKAR